MGAHRHDAGGGSGARRTVPAREGYDRWAPLYDAHQNPLIVVEEPHLARMLGEVEGLEAADLGCGTGRHALALAAAGARVTALDFSPGMMAQARAKPGAALIRFIAADFTAPLPLKSAAFDRVLCCLIADHAPRLGDLLDESARILKPAGFIVMTTVHPAMHLRGVRARFDDPATGAKVYPQSYDHPISAYVTAAQRAGLRFDEISEHVFDAASLEKMPKARRYLNWPILLAMRLRKAA